MSTSRKTKRPAPVKFLNLPLQHKRLRAKLLSRLGQVLDGSRFILGPEVQALEHEIAAICGVKFGVGLNSGTDALLLALRALNIGPGDEVIVPDFTFIATATAVLLAGATPVLTDIEPVYFGLDPDAAARRITSRTKAIIPVHLYGQTADLTAIMNLAQRHGLLVIEDACQALGATLNRRPAGAWGDAAALSFFPTKNLGGIGDGGMLVTQREDLAQRVRRLRDHGSEVKYEHLETGYNSRLDEVQAAVLRVKRPLLAAWNRQRALLAKLYDRELADLPLILPATRTGAGHVYHQYALRSADREGLRKHLASRHIETAIHYPRPLHTQPALMALPSAQDDFPHSTRASREVLCLPIAPETTLAEARRAAAAIREYFAPGRA